MSRLLALSLICLPTTFALADGRPMTVDDLLAVKTVSDPQVSPDGKSVVYVVSEIDRDKNKANSDLWLVPIAGGEPRRLTTSPGADNHPRWRPDGKTIAFVSDRGGSAQVWLLPIDEGGEARQLSKLPIDVSGPIWSPKGDKLAVVAEVFPGKSPEQTAKLDAEKAASKANVRAFDDLMVRHWSSWDAGKRSHVFIVDASSGEAKDLIPDWKANVPPAPFGGSNDYAFSPDGSELAFTSEPTKEMAWSTNTDIWAVSAGGGEPRNATEANKGADAQPAYSPNGKFLAYVSQDRAGFEADLWRIKFLRLDDKKVVTVSELDFPIQSFIWVESDSPKDLGNHKAKLIAVVDREGNEPIVEIDFTDNGVCGSYMDDVRIKAGVNTAVQVAPNRKDLVFLHQDATHPAEVYTATVRSPLPPIDCLPEAALPAEVDAARSDDSGLRQLTRHNTPLIEKLDLAKAEDFTFSGADGDKVHGWLVRPAGFDKSKKYPVLFLIHGGPQGAWHDEWHARWNYQLFVAPGYAVVAINPRGSTGYGQKFTDQISQDWTGRVYEDLMKGLDHALKAYPFLDETRMAAAGGSYGGFMVNWICGHTDRFKALISHAGVFDLTSKYYTTEELWFPEWEFGGPPWKDPEHYRRNSPSSYVENFKTPTLVIHGALDYRVTDNQGLGMFTALRRRGVPSRYVFFPDEGHWILKPANRMVWWGEMHGWLAKYLGSGSR